MRSLFLFILFGFLMVIIESRPSQSDENSEGQDELAEYEGDSGASDQDNEGSSFSNDEPTNQEIEQDRRLLERDQNTYLDKNVAEDAADQSNVDITEDKLTRNRDIRNDRYEQTVNEEFPGYRDNKPRRENRYIETDETNEQQDAQHSNTPNRNAINDDYKLNRMHNYRLVEYPLKRNIDPKQVTTEDTELLFGNNRDPTSKADKNDYILESYEPSQRQLASNDKQYNSHPENRVMLNVNNKNNDRVYYSRDRRAAKKSNPKDTVDTDSNVSTASEGLEKADNENEEMAIRRHIKKLSENELEELFNSLSEDKRVLLKKIIDDTDASENNNINKREITKKAYVDPSESCRMEGGSSSIDLSTEYAMPKSELSTKQSEDTILTNSKSESNSENKRELKTDERSDLSVHDFNPNADVSKNQAKVESNEQVTQKTDKKRDTNIQDVSPASLEDSKVQSDENAKHDVVGYFSAKDEDLFPFLDDDQPQFYDTSKMYKRDVEKQSEFENKLKSLEESFPNPDSYDDPAPYSGPLVRVKRTNLDGNINKRAVDFLPESKVGFFSYKETDDADNEEGSEFDDDGFYDPAPNFVSKDNNNKNAETNSQQAGGEGANCILNTDRSKSPNSDTNIGTISLGSDTDNVLSGVEGVDENIMFNSGNRNRRKTDGNLSENLDGTNHIVQSPYGKTSDDEAKDTSNMNLNVPMYQESDSFGGLPHNYEGDLGRYKRIRRVKQSHVSDNEPSANT